MGKVLRFSFGQNHPEIKPVCKFLKTIWFESILLYIPLDQKCFNIIINALSIIGQLCFQYLNNKFIKTKFQDQISVSKQSIRVIDRGWKWPIKCPENDILLTSEVDSCHSSNRFSLLSVLNFWMSCLWFWSNSVGWRFKDNLLTQEFFL